MIKHNDIYIKFMIEYDKAGAATSYPSLTEYEVATFLDKAYNALIAQKVTGNNYRRAGFEADLKSVADLQPLICKGFAGLLVNQDYGGNVVGCSLDGLSPEMLYFIQADSVNTTHTKWWSDGSAIVNEFDEVTNDDPIDDKGADDRIVPIKLVTHEMAKNFFITPTNMPWIKEPIAFLENNELYVVHDPLDSTINLNTIRVTYIKKPNTFVKNLSDSSYPQGSTYFKPGTGYTGTAYDFECNGTVAEELVSLAVSFALENVESQRLNSKLNMRGLEA